MKIDNSLLLDSVLHEEELLQTARKLGVPGPVILWSDLFEYLKLQGTFTILKRAGRRICEFRFRPQTGLSNTSLTCSEILDPIALQSLVRSAIQRLFESRNQVAQVSA